MRRYIWGGSALAVLLLFSAVLGPRPFYLPGQDNPRIAKDGGPIQFLTAAGDQERNRKDMKTRAQIAAQDMAVTTALCVRDCRISLQTLANQLEHTTNPALRDSLLKDMLKQHPQFRSITLHSPDGQQAVTGTPAHTDRIKEGMDGVRKTNQFYVTDLYEGPGTKSQLLLTMALPLLQNSKTAGVLAAEVEMGFLRSVADQVDDQMGTQSVLHNHDGAQVPFHPEKQNTMNIQSASQHGVDGTKWKTSSSTVRGTAADNNKPRHKANEVVVQFHHEPDQATLNKITSEINGKILKRNHLPTYVFRSESMSNDQLITYFQKMGVKMVEPNKLMRQNELPNDQLYQRYQWNFPQINIENAWKFTTGDPSAIVAIVDTGVDMDHPEFQGQLVPGRNILADNDKPQDDNGHGTHVAGVVVARTNNIEGVAGMNWTSKVMPIKALDAEGSGSVFDIADGIRWAADNGAKVINLSLGEYEDSAYLQQAIQYATSKDVLVVAAMGNDDTEQPSYPAAYSDVLAVAAVDENGKRASFSNYGAHAGVAAPGVSIPSTYPGHRYAAMSGTSMASPHVAGLAGLVRAANPGLTAAQVKDIIMRTAKDIGPRGKDRYYGTGLINVADAIQAAQAQAAGGPDQANKGLPAEPKPAQKAPWWWPFRLFR